MAPEAVRYPPDSEMTPEAEPVAAYEMTPVTAPVAGPEMTPVADPPLTAEGKLTSTDSVLCRTPVVKSTVPSTSGSVV